MQKVFESERINYVKVDPNLINDYLKNFYHFFYGKM